MLGTILGIANLFTALLVGGLSVPMMLGKVAPNPLYGARFSKSFESDENWYAINAHAGKLFVLFSFILVAVGVSCFFLAPAEEDLWLVLALASAPLLYLLPCWLSWRFARRL